MDVDLDIRLNGFDCRRRDTWRELSGVAGGEVSVVVYVEETLDVRRVFRLLVSYSSKRERAKSLE